MAESAGDKTEKATPHKRENERKEGNVFQSKEILICVTMIVSFFCFKLLYNLIEDTIVNTMKDFFGLIPTQVVITFDDAKSFLIRGLKAVAIAAMPLLLITGVVAIIVTFVQTRGLVNTKQLRPKFSRMDPIRGFKNLFSLRSIIELLKASLKILILFFVIFTFVKDNLSLFSNMMNISVEAAVPIIGDYCFSLIKKVTIAFIAVAALDFMYQRWDYEKKLMMTKQEVKDEYKSIEGNPQIKGRIKQIQQEMSRQRMMQAVPTADVVIRNPTHVAVALKYDRDKSMAPVVVAKGVDEIALKIVKIAEENGIMTVENVALARALYAQVELDDMIPVEFYQAVAEIIAALYKQRNELM